CSEGEAKEKEEDEARSALWCISQNGVGAQRSGRDAESQPSLHAVCTPRIRARGSQKKRKKKKRLKKQQATNRAREEEEEDDDGAAMDDAGRGQGRMQLFALPTHRRVAAINQRT